MRYGDFAPLCERAPLPICRVFVSKPVQPLCHTDNYDVGSARLTNIPDFVISIIAFLVTMYLGFRANRRHYAVGRREMALLLTFFCITLLFNIVGADFIFPGSPKVNQWLAITNTALLIGFFVMLVANGFVGFQILADGYIASMLTISVTVAVFIIAFGYFAADTAFDISGGLSPKPSDQFYSPGLFTMYLVFPLVAVVFYLGVQTLLVTKYLSVRLPMWWLISAFVCFAVGQVLMFVASKKICNGSDGKLDGAFFATLLDSAAVFSIYSYWTSITVNDESEEQYEDPYKQY